ncbi:hypothetical protein BABINDRAFT_163458 [Babjeviella inositovora NRRL Y-12698]|uniref:ATP-dependent 6-phosphofructokinase n=1 Tax=Babjeviella inositovora NRRL Y-12698 TaxID=984486 RepID=A0A1E3QIB2_9ASCO|nr:uncharacterized protein BABINDRAFT_163458 [Babjeviella inositovora NRRL Y-12698]ODQ77436.1 hypothetical protein BABINDRAFT_163458 [Babjeviella inositovora NRRL Y-12698]
MSYISGVAFTSLVTTSHEAYLAAIAFYTGLGFTIVRNYTKTVNLQEGSYNLAGISAGSLRECWLESFPLTPLGATGAKKPAQECTSVQTTDETVLKLRLATDSTDHAVCQLPNSGAVVFFSANIAELRRKLAAMDIPTIEEPAAHVDFYVHDPLGNRIGFSSQQRPFLAPCLSADQYTEDSPEAVAAPRRAASGKKKIAVMTSGGDAPGMNPAVRAVVRAGIYAGFDVFAIYEGYEGLVGGGAQIKQMAWADVRGWLSLGGTLIGTARCAAFRERAGRLQACYNLIVQGIDALVVCGGDGSLTGADTFRSDWPSLTAELVSLGRLTPEQIAPYPELTVVGLVGSIDNDMATTDTTIGAYSSLERICEMVDYIDATANSHSRAFVVEVMGRHCGWLALMAGLATGADYIFIPERPPKKDEWAAELRAVAHRHREKGKRRTTVIVAEGAIDDELNPITSDDVQAVLSGMGLDSRITTLGHVQRGGSAVAYDRALATLQGCEAVYAIAEMEPGTPSPMIGVQGNKIVRTPLVEAVRVTQSVAKAIEARDFDAAMALRDAEFSDTYKMFISTSMCDDGRDILPESARLNIGIIHVGAPSSGLNPATRAAALYCLSKGHSLFAIENGFTGLISEGRLRKLEWLDVENWHNLGGSEIGTNRSLPSENFGQVAYCLQKFALDGLIIVGGFEAFVALHELETARPNYPVFRIPLVCLPATLSNNVPGTEYSLGSDTCLNVLTGYCDAIKQSASASRRRIFVVEVQGGNSGYLAAFTSLITGALATYAPEEKVTLRKIQEDIALLHESFSKDVGDNRGGKLLIRNEKASKIYSTELIADIIKESGKGRFESRTAIPGHVQQGRAPSSLDRTYAARLAIKSCMFIEYLVREGRSSRGEPTVPYDEYFVKSVERHMLPGGKTAVVIGVEAAEIKFRDISDLWTHEANVELRKGRTIHWQHMNGVTDMLNGRAVMRERTGSQ